jgi:hypothetical protein
LNTIVLPRAIAQIVQRHHHREIERRDRRHHAEREMLQPTLDPPAHLEHFPGGDLRQRDGKLAQLHRLVDLGLRLGADLAMLLGDQCRQLAPVGVEQRTVAEEDLHPLLERRRRPGGERRPGRRGRGGDVGRAAQRHPGDHLARGRVRLTFRRGGAPPRRGDGRKGVMAAAARHGVSERMPPN